MSPRLHSNPLPHTQVVEQLNKNIHVSKVRHSSKTLIEQMWVECDLEGFVRFVQWCADPFSRSRFKYEPLPNRHDQENRSEAMVELAKDPHALFNALNALTNSFKPKFSVPALLAAGSRVDIVNQVLSHNWPILKTKTLCSSSLFVNGRSVTERIVLDSRPDGSVLPVKLKCAESLLLERDANSKCLDLFFCIS